MAVVLLAALVALAAVQQTASRLTWSFARDSALVGSQFFGQIHPRLGVPVWSLVANAFVVLIIGCIYLGSSTAFNAFIGTSLLLQQITYAFPAALLMYRKRKARYLPVNRPFKLPGAFGWIANFATVAFAVVVLIFYNFPVVLPVIGSTMSKSASPPSPSGPLAEYDSLRLHLSGDCSHGAVCSYQLVHPCENQVSWTETGRVLVRRKPCSILQPIKLKNAAVTIIRLIVRCM